MRHSVKGSDLVYLFAGRFKLWNVSVILRQIRVFLLTQWGSNRTVFRYSVLGISVFMWLASADGIRSASACICGAVCCVTSTHILGGKKKRQAETDTDEVEWLREYSCQHKPNTSTHLVGGKITSGRSRHGWSCREFTYQVESVMSWVSESEFHLLKLRS